MPRVSRGVTKRRRHKKVLAQTKGHMGGRHALVRQARESLFHALAYAYRHRRERKGDLRRLWIVRINAAARQHGLTYSRFMALLKQANIGLDRKTLADLAARDPNAFGQIVARAQSAAGT